MRHKTKMNLNNYFSSIEKREFFEKIKGQKQYYKIETIIKRLNGNVENVEYIVIEEWNKNNPYIRTCDKDNVWKFFVYAFGEVRMITDSIFYIKTEIETTFLYISPILSQENELMEMKVIVNMFRCFNNGKEMFELDRAGYMMKKVCEEICEKVAEKRAIERSVRKIQEGCHNWLWKPECKDGSVGVNVRLGWEECKKTILN